jgi:hypothetical protein
MRKAFRCRRDSMTDPVKEWSSKASRVSESQKRVKVGWQCDPALWQGVSVRITLRLCSTLSLKATGRSTLLCPILRPARANSALKSNRPDAVMSRPISNIDQSPLRSLHTTQSESTQHAQPIRERQALVAHPRRVRRTSNNLRRSGSLNRVQPRRVVPEKPGGPDQTDNHGSGRERLGQGGVFKEPAREHR